jgi:hypothetical protein
VPPKINQNRKRWLNVLLTGICMRKKVKGERKYLSDGKYESS